MGLGRSWEKVRAALLGKGVSTEAVVDGPATVPGGPSPPHAPQTSPGSPPVTPEAGAKALLEPAIAGPDIDTKPSEPASAAVIDAAIEELAPDRDAGSSLVQLATALRHGMASVRPDRRR